MKREFGVTDACRHAEVCLAAFAEPLIKGNLFESRVKRVMFVRSLGSHKGSAEDEEYETANQSTCYSRQQQSVVGRSPQRSWTPWSAADALVGLFTRRCA